MQFRKHVCCFFLLLPVLSCSSKHHSWFTSLDNTGTYSSARMVDLNNDNILDVVIGAGGKEEIHSDTAVMALDGATGKILWAIPGSNQFVGSAVFKDINNDKIADVFIGGRWAQLTAISGADGKVLWTFFPERTKVDGGDGGWYNFTTPQFVPDQDGDGIDDLIIANGGDAKAAPYDISRPVGRLLVLSSKNGKILANVAVPDGKETYMSVVCVAGVDKDWKVLFGTGGETIGGHLYSSSLHDIMRGNISGARILAGSEIKGFVASPVLADINKDGVKDIIVNAVDGRMMAIDGVSDSVLWQVNFPGTEAYTIPAAGFFNDDSIPDFFANFAIGVFPRLTKSIRFMVDGSNGKIVYQDTIPSFQYASAVVADLNGDGNDEVIVNQSELKRMQFENKYYSYLLAFDFKNHRKYSLGDTIQATNLASTPWIGDIDADGKYDIISSAVKYKNAQFDMQQPLSLLISCYRTDYKITKPVVWGAFMGSSYTGIFDLPGNNAHR
ncbi:MAG TPA: PQQ-binding-like beta-propeller repeat protein [Chitinophagaceae bacterium]|nr:PQQ-binding-like beta-propeller repeat protein [Chitinophagaceae bacterium]